VSRSTQLVAAGLALTAGLIGVIFLATRAGSPRGWIDQRYRYVSGDRSIPSVIYSSPKPPSAVVGEITRRWKPADRRSDPSGQFLRYRDLMVAVTPQDGGSRIHVDDEDRGYARWYPIVGGYWGTYSGPGPRARAGGPGAGK
jgi:hypothetical protein